MSRVLTSMRAVCAAAFLISGAVAAQTYRVAPELWDRPRSVRAVLDEPAVREAVRSYLKRADARLVIHFPPGQESLLYAEELKSWLISAAVESERIVLRPDAARGEPLTMEVTQ